MSIEAERRWLMIAIALGRMANDMRESQLKAPSKKVQRP